MKHFNQFAFPATISTTTLLFLNFAELGSMVNKPTAQGHWTHLALHTLGWKAFQDLSAHVCEEVLKRPVEIFREAQDGGQDAVFQAKPSKKKGRSETATVQCKFTSKSSRRLKPGDLTAEESNVVELVRNGNADTYILMTNMSVDAPVALKIKSRLRKLGVLHPHVFGGEFLTRSIRTSRKLRALVPRVYGLGDLSEILDERQAEQTSALLGHMLPTLKVYVPTRPHVQAVQALTKHGVVLLLGSPATGKSSIAAILSTTAAEQHQCFKSDGPLELPANWNPNEQGRLFWIDDAFGPNQLREDFVDHWINIMPKIQAAIGNGNRFILTSRTHIYQAAIGKLGTRNLSVFRDKSAIVNVGDLSQSERRQILYNHIKMGTQPKAWKSRIKPQLESLAQEKSLLPEIARRLGDSAYTKQITTANDSILKFIQKPKEHLLQTIQELSNTNQAALILIFLHRGRMPNGDISPAIQQLLNKHFQIDIHSLGNAISALRDTFVVQRTEEGRTFWTFKHPTISDALSSLLGETEGMAELYLYGSKSEVILDEVVCVDANSEVQDAVHIPNSLNRLLVERLAELPDEYGINRRLFAFLYERASDEVFRSFVEAVPSALSRNMGYSWRLGYEAKLLAHGRANSLGLLPAIVREQSAALLESGLFNDADASFLNDDNLLQLLKPSRLIQLYLRVKEELIPSMFEMVDDIVDSADLDFDAASHFEELDSTINYIIEAFSHDAEITDALFDVQDAINQGTSQIEEKQKEKEEEDNYDGREWEFYAKRARNNLTEGRGGSTGVSSLADDQPRSIFSDVDH